jgi:CubicO group peptidase (beta-lactamase class C family)
MTTASWSDGEGARAAFTSSPRYGAVLLIARGEKIAYLQAIGYQDREKKTPMKVDAIFRLASMTKPIVSVAAMMLVEEGKLDLLAPVAQYLPEFKDMKVGVDLPPFTRPRRFRTRPGLVYGAEMAESRSRTSGCVARRGPRLPRRNCAMTF